MLYVIYFLELLAGLAEATTLNIVYLRDIVRSHAMAKPWAPVK